MGFVVEGVGACSQRDERLSGEVVVRKVLHLSIRPVPEPEQHHAKVCRIQRLQPRFVVLRVRVDFAAWVDGKQDGALKSKPISQDLGQLRQALFRPVLLVSGEKHHTLPLARPVLAFVHHPLWRGRFEIRSRQSDRSHRKESYHSHLQDVMEPEKAPFRVARNSSTRVNRKTVTRVSLSRHFVAGEGSGRGWRPRKRPWRQTHTHSASHGKQGPAQLPIVELRDPSKPR